MDSSILQDATRFWQHIDTTVVETATQAAARLSRALVQPALALVTIYFILFGIALYRGAIENLTGDLINRVFRVSLTLAFALAWGSNGGNISAFVFRFPVELAALLANLGETGPQSAIDIMLTKTQDTVLVFIDRANFFTNPVLASVLYVCAFVTLIFGTAVGAFALVMALVSKIGAGVCIALAPLFILSLLFDSTKKFFEAWVAQTVNFMLHYVITIFVVTLTFDYFSSTLDSAAANVEYGLSVLQPVVLIGVASLMFIIQGGAFASALAGGMQITSGGVIGTAARLMGKRPSSAGGTGGGGGGKGGNGIQQRP